jgi:hypothetical protein
MRDFSSSKKEAPFPLFPLQCRQGINAGCACRRDVGGGHRAGLNSAETRA